MFLIFECYEQKNSILGLKNLFLSMDLKRNFKVQSDTTT